MQDIFLEETEASVVAFDLRGFSHLAETLPPLELGLALGDFYTHAESIVLAHGGRVVRFVGDMVLAAWLAKEQPSHQLLALDAVGDAACGRPAWIAQNRAAGKPALDFSIAAASGLVLAGHIGTERQKSFDVLGKPVVAVVKLTTLATVRGRSHLCTFTVPEHLAVEVEGVELGGNALRLFRLAEAT